MTRRELDHSLSWLILGVSLAAFATGLVMLTCSHMGEGPFAASAGGVGRLAWLNLHRFSAAGTLLGVAAHVWLNRRPFWSRIKRAVARRSPEGRSPEAVRSPVGRQPGGAVRPPQGSGGHVFDAELLMYGAFGVAAVTGFVAWLVLAGGSPVGGPVLLGPAVGVRHPWIDPHHVASLVSLVLVVHHVAHRWRRMVRVTRTPPGAPG